LEAEFVPHETLEHKHMFWTQGKSCLGGPISFGRFSRGGGMRSCHVVMRSRLYKCGTESKKRQRTLAVFACPANSHF
jgi:hypothetical protein